MKVIILGFGTMGKAHLDAYRKMRDVEVVGIYSRSARHDQNIGIPFCDQIDACLNQEADIVDICLPTFLHKEAYVKAIQKDRHIFIEKPIAHTMEDLEEMLTLAKEYPKKIMVGHVLRYLPEYIKLKEKVIPNKPASALLSRRSKLPDGVDQWFVNPSKSGGIILDLSLHDIDFLYWTLGPVTRVFAQTDPEHHYALITLRHQNQSISRIEASWHYYGGFTMEAEIAQEGQLYTYNNQSTTPLRLFKAESPKRDAVELPAIFLHENPFYRELNDFIQAIREDKEVPITLADAYESTKIALLAIQSAHDKKPVVVGRE